VSLAIVFPGQGSQSVGMLGPLAERYPLVRETFAEASRALGYDLWAVTSQGPDTELNRTEVTQPAMLAAGVAVYRLWQDQGGATPALMAGHSLGEYSALVCAGALDFETGVELVAERGRLMQNAVPAGQGAMAAVLGLDDAVVRAVCEQASEGEVVEAVNFNAPGQVVIAGESAAVERAAALAKEQGAKRVLPLPVSVPSHSSLMRPAAEALHTHLEQIEIRVPEIPVLHNVDAATRDSADAIREALARQLHSPVQWVQTEQAMLAQGASAFVEAGPGKVLTGLIKRIDKTARALPLFDPASLEAALQEN
jgi:[acyl-carrier-protein] S-malonyltransferase